VRVSVEGELYAGVAEEVLDEFRVRAAREQEGGAGVPEIVPAGVGYINRLGMDILSPVKEAS
jgi:hypothetical protein